MSSTPQVRAAAPPRSIPAAIGISLLMSAVCGAAGFFIALFFAIVVFLVLATMRGGAGSVNFADTYRLVAMPAGFAGLFFGFVVTLVLSLRKRSRRAA